MNVKDYILFTGLNTDEIKDFISDGKFIIEQIREGDGENKIPHWFSFTIEYKYHHNTKSLELHPSDYLIKFYDNLTKEDYYRVVQHQNWESSKKYLGIRED